MGAFIANLHVRSEDEEGVRRTMADIGASSFHVAAPGKGWISIYEQRASTQDEDWIADLAGQLSSRLHTVCVGFLVHDSDIARYWLSDQGKLLDEYNSIPDYFDEVSAAIRERVQGRPDIFLRYCQPGVTREQIEAVLRADVVFADDTITQLAGFLGIDPGRALGDFKYAGGDDGGGGLQAFGGDDDGEMAPATDSGLGGMMEKMQQQFSGMFAAPTEQGTPESNALVEAAAAGNVAEIERLVQSGADVNAPGLLPMQAPGGSSLLGGMAMPMMPKVAQSPLLAAASRGQAAAVQRLLELGANATEDHALYGTPLHVAAQSGSTETMRLLLAAGIPAGVKNKQGFTPLALIQAVRNQIDMVKNMVKMMPQMQKVYDQLAGKLADLPEAGWEACEELLRQAGG
jgi:hypothetical protein